MSATVPLALEDARALWSPETVYLNTASFGLPPRPAWDALQAALDDWRGGRTSWERWADTTDASRAAFAALVGVEPARVAVGATVSGLVGLIAAALPDGARVLAAEGDFTSLIFPFLAEAGRGVEVRFVAVADLPEAVDGGTDLVACSAVQSASGEVADVAALAAAARHHGALTVLDATQACGWLPVDAGPFDAVACAAYKWLMSPRGTAFMTLSDALAERVVPHAAGWFAGEDVHASYYGAPLRLAESARASTPLPPGSPGWARRRRSSSSAGSASPRSTTTTSGSPTACGPGSASRSRTRRS